MEQDKLRKEIEERFSEIGRRIGALQQLEVLVKTLLESVSAIQGILNGQDQEIGKAALHAMKLQKDIKSVEVSANIKFDETRTGFKREIEALKHVVSQSIDADGKLFKEIDKRFASVEDLQKRIGSFSSKVEADLLNHSGYIKGLQDSLNPIHRCLKDNETNLSTLNSVLVGRGHDVDASKQRIDKLEKDVLASTKHLQANIDDVAANYPAKISKAIEELQSKMEHYISHIFYNFEAAIPKDLLTKIDMIQLDAKNSILKSNNSETQIKFLEKKLENLTLQLKQYELRQ